LDELLGRDGIAEVWRGRDLMSDRPVTVKLLPRREAAPSRRRSRRDPKVRAAARIGYLAADRVLDVGEYEGRPFLVLDGDAVADERAKSPQTSPGQTGPVLGAIAQMIPRALRVVPLLTLIEVVMGILLIATAVWMVTWPGPSAHIAAPAPSTRPPAAPVPVIPTPSPTGRAPDRKATGGIDGDAIRETNKKTTQIGPKGPGKSQDAPGRSRGLGKGQAKKR
jgi:hypothetical protein